MHDAACLSTGLPEYLRLSASLHCAIGLANGCPRKMTDTVLCRMERQHMLAHSGRRTAGSIMHLMVSNSSFCNSLGLYANGFCSTSRMAEGWEQKQFLPYAAAAAYESLVCMRM